LLPPWICDRKLFCHSSNNGNDNDTIKSYKYTILDHKTLFTDTQLDDITTTYNAHLLDEYSVVWQPIRPDPSESSQYTIYTTVCNRINYIESLLNKVTSLFQLNKPVLYKLTRSLRSLQNQYQLLSLHMEWKHHYTNDQLLSIYSEHGVAPLHMFMPCRKTIFDLEELPDLLKVISLLQVLGKQI
jgi:hypothetical protein